jgi:hypothetical protein
MPLEFLVADSLHISRKWQQQYHLQKLLKKLTVASYSIHLPPSVQPNVHHRVHNSPPLDPTPSHSNLIHTPQSISPGSVLILSSHVRLRLPSCLFPSALRTKIVYKFLTTHACYMPRPTHSPWCNHPKNTVEHNELFCSLLSHRPSCVQILSLAPCF